jgi:hypothetical protein
MQDPCVPYCPIKIITPSAVRTPATDACTATGPAGAAGGIRMVTWYNPAHPVVSTVLTTSAATPPTMTVGAVTVAGAPLTVVPAGTEGLVAPKPVPQSTTKSPGRAATVPGTAAGSATAAQSGRRDAET